MSQTIDNRIVEMQFDNKQFESGVSESLSTLDKLKQALKFDDASKNLQDFGKNVGKNIDLSGISKSVEDLNSKFSLSGIAGMEAIRKLTDFAISAGKTIANALDAPFKQMREGGWKRAMNIEDAKFQLQGLGVTWQSVSKDIDYAVADTAYGLDVAAKACAQLSASGVQAGDDMKAALRGISGVAAMGNTEYENISRIFTKAAGNGRVMADELNRISGYGLNASASLAKFFNTIDDQKDIPEEVVQKIKELSKGVKVTESDIREFASKSQIDFQTFAYAMDNAFGEHAKKANETFFGAMSNIKAALNKIGAEFATPFIKGAIPVLNEVRVFLNDIRKQMGPIFDTFANFAGTVSTKLTAKLKEFRLALIGKHGFAEPIHNLMDAFNNIKVAVVRVVAAVLSAYRTVFPQTRSMAESLKSVTEGIANFTKKLIMSDGTLLAFRNVMIVVFNILKMIGTILSNILPIIGKVISFIFRIISGISSLLGYLTTLISKLDIVKTAMNAIQKAGGLISFVIEKLKTAFGNLRDILNDTSTVTGRFFTKLKEIAGTAVLIIAGTLYLAFVKIKDVISYFDTHDPLDSLVKGAKALMDTLKSLPIFNTIISGIQKAFNVVALVISKAVGLVKDFINNLRSGMSVAHAIGNTLSSVVFGVIGLIVNLIEKITSLFSLFKKDRVIEEEVIMPINGASKALVGVEQTLTKTSDGVKKTSSAFEKGKNSITSFASAILDKIRSIRTGQVLLFAFGTTITILATNLIKLTQSFTNLTNSAAYAVKGLGRFFNDFGKKRTSFSEGMIAIAIAIGAMTASLWAMSKIPTRKLIEVAGVLEVLLVTMGAFSLIGKNGVGPFASAMISFSGGILLLVSALYALDQINMDGIEKKWATLGIISGIVLTVSIILSKAAPQLSRGGLGLLAFSGAVYVLAKALDIVAKINLNNIKENWVELCAVIIAFGAFASLVSNVGITAALGLIAFIGILKLLSKHTETIKKNFENIQDIFKTVADALKGAVSYLYNGLKKSADDMKKNEMLAKVMTGSAVAVITALLGFILAIGHAGKGIKKASIGFAIILAAIAGVMYVMAKISEMIKNVNDPNAVKIATNILYSLLIFIGALATIGTIRDKIKIEDGVNTLKDVRKLMTSLGLLLLSIGALAAMVGTLSEDEFKRTERMIIETEIIIGAIATFCTIITAVASKAGKSEVSFGTFAGIVALLGGLLGSIAVLMFMFSQVDWEKDKQQLIAASIAFGSIIVSIIAIMGMLALLTSQASKEGSGKAIGILWSFVGVILAIAGVVYALTKTLTSNEEMNRAKTITIGLVGFLTILTVLIVALEKFSTKLLNTDKRKEAFKKTFNTLLVMLGAVVAFGVGLYALQNVDAGRMWGQVTAIMFLLTAVSALVLALQKYSKDSRFTFTKKSSETFNRTIKYIGLAILAVGALATVFGLMHNVDAGRMWGQVLAITFLLAALVGLVEGLVFLNKKLDTQWGDLKKAGVTIAGMTVIFGVLALIFKVIDSLKVEGIVKKSQAIVLVLLELEALAFIASTFGGDNIVKNFAKGELVLLGMVSLFGLLTLVFTVINDLKIEGIVAKSQAIILVMLELEVLAVGAAALGTLMNAGGILALGELALLGMIGLFWALTEVFTVIDELKTDGIVAKSQAIILVLLELEALAAICSILGPFLPVIAMGELTLLGMVGLFWALAEVFTIIDGLKTDGIVAKSQAIILVLLELEVLGTLSVLSMPALFGAPGLFAMIEMFGKLAVAFGLLNDLKTDGLLEKSQAIILVLLELEGLSILSVLGVMALAGAPGLDAMVDIFGKLAVMFGLLNGLQLEGMAQKANILIETIATLAGMGVEGFFNSFGLEDLAECLGDLTNVIVELTSHATEFSLSITTMSSSMLVLLATGPQLIAWATGVSSSMTTLKATLSESANAIINIIKNMVDGMAHALSEGRVVIGQEAVALGKELEKGMTKDLQPKKWGSELVNNFASGIKGALGGLASAAESMARTVWEYIHFSEGSEKGYLKAGNVKKWGSELDGQFGSGIISGLPGVSEAASKIGAAVSNGLGNIDISKLKEMGAGAIKALTNGMGSEVGGLESIVNYVMGLVSQVKSAYSMGYGTLSDFDYQLTTRISSTEKQIARANETIRRTNPNIKGGAEAIKAAKQQLAELEPKLKADREQLDGLRKGTPPATEATKDLSDALSGLGDAGKKGAEGTTEIKDEIADFYDKMEGAISLFSEFNKETELTSDKLISNMRSQIEGMTEWANQIQKLAFMGIDQGLLQQLAEMGPQGYEYTNAFVHMTAEQLQEANNLYHQSLMLPSKVTSQVYGSYTIAGRSAASGFLQGMSKEDIKGAAVNFAHDVVDQMNLALDIVSGYSKVTYEDGVAVVNGVKTGMNAPYVKQNLDTAVKLLADNNIKAGFENNLINSNTMYTIGANVTNGIANGIEDDNAKGKAKKSIENLCGMIITRAEEMFQTASPSKVFKKIGGFLSQGLAIGITKEAQSAVSAMGTTSESIIDTMRDTINKANEALVDGVDQPVITPVLDLSEIQNGSRQLDNMLSQNQALSASRSFTNLQNAQWGSQDALLNATMDNTDVVSAISSLSDDINTLKDAMTNIKMVLDTGTMVGAMTPQIDQQLGMRQVYAGRGI